MDWLVIGLRIVHIGAAVFWAGSAFFFFLFVEPTARALGPDAGKFMHHVVAQRRIVSRVVGASTLTVLAGALLYWRDSAGLTASWITSPAGLAFTLGGLTGLVAWLDGVVGIGPSVTNLDRLATSIATVGRPPSNEQLSALDALQVRLRRLGQLDVVMLSIAIVAMAAARYLFA